MQARTSSPRSTVRLRWKRKKRMNLRLGRNELHMAARRCQCVMFKVEPSMWSVSERKQAQERHWQGGGGGEALTRVGRVGCLADDLAIRLVAELGHVKADLNDILDKLDRILDAAILVLSYKHQPKVSHEHRHYAPNSKHGHYAQLHSSSINPQPSSKP